MAAKICADPPSPHDFMFLLTPQGTAEGRIAQTDIVCAPRFVDLLAGEAQRKDLRKGERTRCQIRYATAICLEKTTFPLLSMDMIAANAGISRTALYKYYNSKHELVKEVLTDFHNRTIAFPRSVTARKAPGDAVYRTNRYYIDYFAKNAVLMERIRELRHDIPQLLKERQRINESWSGRILEHVLRHNPGTDGATQKIRILCLECMIDDVLREIFVINNPSFVAALQNPEQLASELTGIWLDVLYRTSPRPLRQAEG